MPQVLPPPDGPTDIDAAIAFLRNCAWSKIETIRWLHDKHGLALQAAKERIHFSPAWADQQAYNDALHAEIENAMKRA